MATVFLVAHDIVAHIASGCDVAQNSRNWQGFFCEMFCMRIDFLKRPSRSAARRRIGSSSSCQVIVVLLLAGIGSALGEQSWGAEPLQSVAAANVGTVRGTVAYMADPAYPWRLGRYYIKNPKTGLLAEAVVAISSRGLKANDNHEPRTVVVDQKDFQFTPETTAIRAGDHVRFLNSDNHTHNVKTADPKFSFNVTMPVGSEHTETFTTASGAGRPYQIDCVFHSAMRAWIFVFDHPWFQVTPIDGSFELKNVPAGEYRLEIDHPAGRLRHRQTIQVVAGKTLDVSVKLHPNTDKP